MKIDIYQKFNKRIFKFLGINDKCKVAPSAKIRSIEYKITTSLCNYLDKEQLDDCYIKKGGRLTYKASIDLTGYRREMYAHYRGVPKKYIKHYTGVYIIERSVLALSDLSERHMTMRYYLEKVEGITDKQEISHLFEYIQLNLI